MRSILLTAAILAAAGCGREPEGPKPHRSAQAAVHAPAGDPRDLPKVRAEAGEISKMLRERFGETVARTIRVEVQDKPEGLRIGLFGEVPNEEIRTAVMNEVEARVENLRFQDFNLETAGPVPMLWGFPASVAQGESNFFAPDLSFVVTWSGCVYETATGRRLNRIDFGPSPRVRSMALSPDGKLLAVGLRGGEISLFEMVLGRGKRVLQPAGPADKFDDPVAMCFSADSRQLATIHSENGDVRLWDLGRGGVRQIGSHVQPDQPSRLADQYYVAMSPDGRMLASTNFEATTLWLWDLSSRRRLDPPKVDRLSPTALAWSHDGKTIAVGRTTDNARGVLLYEPRTGKSRILSLEPDALLNGLAFSPDDRTLAVGYENEGVKLWDLGSGKVWRSIDREKTGGTRCLRFSPDGAVLGTDCPNVRPPSVRLWNVESRPGGSRAAAELPKGYARIATQDDRLCAQIERGIRGTFDASNIQALKVEMTADGAIRLTGKVSDQEVKRVAGRDAEVHHEPEDIGDRRLNKVINDLQVTGRYERQGTSDR